MKRTLLVFLTVCFIVTLFACEKKGCTNRYALNYNNEAEKNDASCIYEDATVLFYTNKADFEPDYEVYIQGVLMGIIQRTDNDPTHCSDTLSLESYLRVDIPPGKHTYQCHLVGDTFDYAHDFFEVYSGDCSVIKITF